MNWKLIAFIALISYGAYQHFSNRAISHGNGVIASGQPNQQPVSSINNQPIFIPLFGNNNSINFTAVYAVCIQIGISHNEITNIIQILERL